MKDRSSVNSLAPGRLVDQLVGQSVVPSVHRSVSLLICLPIYLLFCLSFQSVRFHNTEAWLLQNKEENQCPPSPSGSQTTPR